MSDDLLGIADNRCPTCEADHGSFRQLVDDVTLVLGDPSAAFDLVKQNRTQDNVAAAVQALPEFEDFSGNLQNNALQSAKETMTEAKLVNPVATL